MAPRSCCSFLPDNMFKLQWLTSLLGRDVGTPRSPPSPPDTSSSATMSPVYPDRPIRPMPRRSLRARLSPEVAETIDYPPVPTSSNSTLFHQSYADDTSQRNGAAIKNALREIDQAMYASHGEIDDEDRQGYKFKASELESEEEDDINLMRQFEQYTQRPGIMASVSRASANGMARNAEAFSHSVASSNDSIDGYDSFENTNNKKKRKIPTSGPLGNQNPPFSSSLSQDLANMGLSNGEGFDIQDSSGIVQGHHYDTGSSTVLATQPGNGISGSGRGRFGRPGRREISGRGPLTSSINSSNAWQTGRFAGPRRDYSSMNSLGSKSTYETERKSRPFNDKQAVSDHPTDRGIISQAIAEAASLPHVPSNGQENMSLLEQQSMKKPSPANTQFTFTCEPEASKGVFWPGNSVGGGTNPHQTGSSKHGPLGSIPQSSLGNTRKDFNTQGTQTSPSMVNQPGQNGTNPQAATQAPQKPRRSAAQRYAITARNRRADQQYNNSQHPPKREDIWICEFCEYESIFGRPPEALIRQYEIKDRKERKRQAEKRRLLEKAKMKGRKGKKGTKNNAKGNSTLAQQQQSVQPPNEPESVPNSSTQIEDSFYDDLEAEANAAVVTHAEPPNHIPQPSVQPPGNVGAKVAHGTGIGRPG